MKDAKTTKEKWIIVKANSKKFWSHCASVVEALIFFCSLRNTQSYKIAPL